MPTRFEIGGEEQDISGKSIEEVAKMVEEYAKQKKIKFKVKKVEEEEEEEEEPYLCVDCGKDFKWKSGTSSAGAGVNSYHCGSCSEDEVEEDRCEYWYANGGTMTFINATEAEMEEIDADEWGSLYDFNDERK